MKSVDVERDFYSAAEVQKKTGLSRVTLWRMTKRDEFPKAVPLSPGRVGYPSEKVNAWIKARTEPALEAA